MTLNEKWSEYQKILIEEYRQKNPEETMGLDDKRVSLICPLTTFDFNSLLFQEMLIIKNQIDDYKEDIEFTENRLKQGNLHFQETTELRNDINDDLRNIAILKEKYNILKNLAIEREDLDERSR